MEFYGQVLSEAAKVPDASETTADLLAGETVIPLARVGDFVMGSHVQIDGAVYAFDDDLTDDGEESGVRSITLTDPLVADVAEGTIVYSWNPNANEGAGDVHCEWQVQVAPAGESDGHTATLADSLVPTTSPNKPPGPGDSVRVLIDDDSSWLVVEKVGGTPGVYPAFIRTGGLGADTVVWAGAENGRRAQLDGIDGALEAFNDANEQTVNLNGETNLVTGTFKTAQDGQRWEMGPGDAGPNNELRGYSNNEHEAAPGRLTVGDVEVDDGIFVGLVALSAPTWDTETVLPSITLTTATSDGLGGSVAQVQAHDVYMNVPGTATIGGGGKLDATMGDGSVGTGTFRDSVDARVTAVAPGAVPAASDTTAGKVELATNAETITGTDTSRAITPANLAASRADMGHIERAETAQSIATGGTPAVVNWATSTVTARGGISFSSGVFTIGTAGTYLTKVYTSLPAGAGARRQCQIRKNGAVGAQTNQTPPTTGVWSSVTTELLDYAAGDTIDVRVFQDSGGALTLTGSITIHRLA